MSPKGSTNPSSGDAAQASARLTMSLHPPFNSRTRYLPWYFKTTSRSTSIDEHNMMRKYPDRDSDEYDGKSHDVLSDKLEISLSWPSQQKLCHDISTTMRIG